MADDRAEDIDIQRHIKNLMAQEHQLRGALAEKSISADEEHQRLRRIETELDQCWDLLRQRRAKREFGENPNEAEVRREGVVEGYRQ
jgi:hypothetical protein